MKRKVLFLAVSSLLADAALAQTPVFTAATAGSSASTGQHTTVTQGTQRAIFDWASFNVGQTASVTFSQPNSTSVAVNRIGGGRSTIDGTLTANGHIMLLNQNGVLFGSTAVVNVGALTASTGQLTVSDAAFINPANGAAPIAITGAGSGGIENRGAITATAGSAGLVAFVAPSVVNSGTITALGGRIVLAGAQAATVSFNGALYEVTVNQGIAGSSVSNTLTGVLTTGTSGGTIVMSALDAANVVSGLINLEGIQRANRIEVHGGEVVLKSDLEAAAVTGSSSLVKVFAGGGQIQDGIDIARSGGTVEVGAGTFTNSKTLKVEKSLALRGAGEDDTFIDARGVTAANGGYGIKVTADDVTLSDFTLYGPAPTTGSVSSAYGIKVQPKDAERSSVVRNFSISNVTSRGAMRAELDLHAVVGASIDHFTADGTPYGAASGTTPGAGIQITDSADVEITNSTTLNNAWGGVALFQANRFYDQQTAGITVDVTPTGNNHFNESNPLYLQNESSTSFGALDLPGFSYAVRNATTVGTGSNQVIQSQFTWMQMTAQGAYDQAVRVGSPATSYVQGWNGSALTQDFYVGVGNLLTTGTFAMSINQAIGTASAGAAVHVGAGTFAEQLWINKSLILVGAGDGTIVSPTSLAADASGMKNILTIGGGATTNVEVSGFTFKGPVPELNAGIFVRDGAYAHIHGNKLVDMRESAVLSGNQRGIGIFVGRALLGTSGRALIQDNYVSGYQKGGIVVDGPGSQATITGNTVIGDGATSATAQNGIQASRGASAHIEGNTVSGNRYTPPGDEATGILIFTPGANLAQGEITVGPNNVSDNEVGVWTNDPRSLTRVNLSGVAGNTRDAVADFGGGYAGQGVLLEYPAWAASSSANVSAGAFGSKLTGDIVGVGGVLRVSGWSGFSAIQPAVDAVAAGATINVDGGTYAESVILDGLRNLQFAGTTIEGLTINTGGAGSGIGGGVTASGSTGFLFNAPIRLLSDTSLATAGARIAFGGDVQTAGGAPYALSLNAGGGDVSMVSGGAQAHPLGPFAVLADDFSLASTLWVSGYDIAAGGNVSLSNSTLNSLGVALAIISAGGSVTGSTTSQGNVQISGGNVTTNILSLGNVAVVADNVGGNITGGFIVIDAQNNVVANVTAQQVAAIQAGGAVEISGSAQTLVINAASGSATGNFGEVVNTGGGVVSVNGVPVANVRVLDPSNQQIVPTKVVTAADSEAGPNTSTMKLLTAETKEARPRAGMSNAAELLRQGQSVEIDLTPGNN